MVIKPIISPPTEVSQGNPFSQKKILNTVEAAQLLDMSPSSLYKLTSQKRIPFYRPNGKRIYFLREEVEAWLLSKRIQTDAEMDVLASNYLTKPPRV